MIKPIALIVGGKISRLNDVDLSDVDIYEQVKISEAVELARELELKGASAIISTSGTAYELKKHIQIPVIQANPTHFDLLEILKFLEEEAKIINEKIALVLHFSRKIEIDKIQPFLKNRIKLFHYENEEDLRGIVNNIFKSNYKVLVGGPTSIYFAREFGMRCFLLNLGKETLLNAIDKAREIIYYREKDREKTQELQTILNLFPDGIMVTDCEGIISFCNKKALIILGLDKNEVIGQNICQIMKDPTWSDVYKKGFKQVDIIKEYKGTKFFTIRQPVIVNNKIVGAVGTLQEISKIEKLEHQYRRFQTLGLTAKYHFKDIIGESEVFKKTIEQAKAYSKVDSTILIEGETGTGKEMFAQSIHNLSSRKEGPFVAINCAALPENLLESELMGYEEGAFTGAKRGGKAGLFELAHKGTIFLDEINQIPLQLQSRILRVIQEKQVMRLGGDRVIPVDVRIIAATNEDLKKLIREGRFRDDLYFRLNVLNLRIPSLKERSEDIPLLIDYYIKKFSEIYGPIKSLSDTAYHFLLNYSWPGNVRELMNFVERYVVLCKNNLVFNDVDYVKEYIMKKEIICQNNIRPDALYVKMDTLENMENQLIRQILQKTGGNKLQAALLLGISRTTLWKKLKNEEEKLKLSSY
jgi:PAS domain S-box-containing protein